MDTPLMDALDEKLAAHFPGRVVRKDLVRQTKTGFNVPVYVLEYLLGKYCSSTDAEVIAQGLDYVRDTLSRNYVRADESEKIKSLTREAGTHRIIDKVKVRLVETEDKYWAELTNMGVKYVNIPEGIVRQYDRLLAGGLWAIINLRYDAGFQHRGQTRPFIIENWLFGISQGKATYGGTPIRRIGDNPQGQGKGVGISNEEYAGRGGCIG